MKKIILIGLSAFGIASAQNAVPPSTFIPGQQAPGAPAAQPGQFPGAAPAAQPGQFPGTAPAAQPGQFPGAAPAADHGSDHMQVHGVVEAASPQKIIVKNETGTLNEFAVDDYSEVILPPIKFIELDQEDHRELTGARVHIGVGVRPNGIKTIDHIHVHMDDDHGPDHDQHAEAPHHQPGPAGAPHASAPGAPIHQPGPAGAPHASAPGAPHHQPGPAGVPHASAPGAPIHQPGPAGVPHASAPGAPIPQPGPAGVPYASAPGAPIPQPGPAGVPYASAPGAPIPQPGPAGVPYASAPGAPIPQPGPADVPPTGAPHHPGGHETPPQGDTAGESLFGTIERADAGKIIIKTEEGSLAELSADDYSEIMFPPEKYLDLDADDHQRMIGQRVNLAIGSRPNGQNAVDHIDILLEDHDEPHHDGPQAIDPNTGNAPLPR